MLKWIKSFLKKDCDQDCVIDTILTQMNGIDNARKEIGDLKRERRNMEEIVRTLKLKILAIGVTINNKEKYLNLAVTKFDMPKDDSNLANIRFTYEEDGRGSIISRGIVITPVSDIIVDEVEQVEEKLDNFLIHSAKLEVRDKKVSAADIIAAVIANGGTIRVEGDLPVKGDLPLEKIEQINQLFNKTEEKMKNQ